MDDQFKNSSNSKAICIPNPIFYEPVYIIRHQNGELDNNQANNNSFFLSETYENNENKSLILNASTEDENTAVEALRQLGNISICTKVEPPEQPSVSCLNCNKPLEIPGLEDNVLHCENCIDDSYKCKICAVLFDSDSSLNTHMKAHYSPTAELLYCNSKDEDDFVNERYEDCDNNSFPVLSNIWDDYELEDEQFTVVAQEMTIHTSKEDELIESNVLEENDDSKRTCKQCNKTFKREKAFQSHVKLHSTFLDVTCIRCEESFVDEESLVKHLEQCNNLKNLTVTKTLLKHACTCCEKAFSTKQKLQRHMWVHRKKAFTCEMCAVCFERQAELDTHRLSTHQSTTGYFCNECGKCFSSRQGLWEHNRIHGPTNHSYKCEECSKAFSSKQGYLIHKRTHNDERPYGCRFCLKAFRDGGTLRKHERIHTGARPHICPLCSKAFNQKVVLREHVRWIHISNLEPNGDVFQCAVCDFTVTEKDDLCAHIVKHSDDMALAARNKIVADEHNSCIKHKCDLCEKEFLNMIQLAQHAQTHI